MTSNPSVTPIPLVRAGYEGILAMWIAVQKRSATARPDLISDADLARQCSEVLSMLLEGLASGSMDVSSPGWEGMRATLRGISLSRGRLGFGPSETALFILSLKEPLFGSLQELDPSSRIDAIL